MSIIRKESVYPESGDNGVRSVNFASLVKNTKFSHSNIHKCTWTSPDGITHNQIDHVLVVKRRQSSIISIRSLRGADCNTDNYLMVTTI